MEAQAHDPRIRPQPKLSARTKAPLLAALRCGAEWLVSDAGATARLAGLGVPLMTAGP